MRCGSEVGLSIVEAVMVYMVNEKMVGRVDNLTVHLNRPPLVFADPLTPGGIICIFELFGMPFVLAQALVIFGVHYGVLALSEWYSAEGVAVVDAAVEQYQSHERPYQAIGNRDGKIEFDNQPQPVMNNHGKFEILSTKS